MIKSISKIATSPKMIRGPAVITDQKSSCWMKTWQKRLNESIICCIKMKVTTGVHCIPVCNVKKRQFKYMKEDVNSNKKNGMATKPVALPKRHVVTDKIISPHNLARGLRFQSGQLI